jgi:tRNA threonylcarbamoyladenosine biosynthesis protein TsaB
MLLAVDTATQLASLALYDQTSGLILGEETWHSVNNHTVELMPRLVRLLSQQGTTPDDLTGLPVSIGPGSFTGLRIGLGVAKGLALARGIPIVGIPTIEIVAQPHMAQHLPIWAIVRAGRGRFCVGQYAQRKGHWYQRGSIRITTLDGLCDQVKGPALLCGEIDVSERDLILGRLEVTIASPASSLRRAAYLAELGWKRLVQGDVDDAATLSPLYLHDSRAHA